jgi:regulator of nucleoside diphosphate kinase
MQKRIVVTTSDMERLELILERHTTRSSPAGLEALEQELSRADVVSPDRVAKNVVTINSRVRLHDLDRGKEFVCSIVFPSEADASRNRVSVLTPLGTALLGDSVGRIVQFPTPGGPRKVKIEAIEYQPEAAERLLRAVPAAGLREE